MSKEPHTEEANTEKRIRSSISSTQTPLKLFDTRSLINLPFPISELPDVFTSFRKRVEAPDMYQEPLPAPTQLKEFATLPDIGKSKGALKIETTEEELLKGLLKPLEDDPGPLPVAAQEIENNTVTAFPLSGGETEALQRFEHYFRGGKNSPAAQYKETRCAELLLLLRTSVGSLTSHSMSPSSQERHVGRRLFDEVFCCSCPWTSLPPPHCTESTAARSRNGRQIKGGRLLDRV